MLQRILNYFRSPASEKRLFVPSSPDLPELWSGNDTTPRLEILNTAPTSTLTVLCDDYWNSFLTDDDDEVSIVRDSQVCRRALELIASRGTEGLQWARQRLTHPGYDARWCHPVSITRARLNAAINNITYLFRICYRNDGKQDYWPSYESRVLIMGAFLSILLWSCQKYS